MKTLFLVGIVMLFSTAAHAQAAAKPEEATVQKEDVTFRVESNAPRCARLAFENVSMTPTLRTEARQKAMAKACAPNAQLPMRDEIITLSDGRTIHFNAESVPTSSTPR